MGIITRVQGASVREAGLRMCRPGCFCVRQRPSAKPRWRHTATVAAATTAGDPGAAGPSWLPCSEECEWHDGGAGRAATREGPVLARALAGESVAKLDVEPVEVTVVVAGQRFAELDPDRHDALVPAVTEPAGRSPTSGGRA